MQLYRASIATPLGDLAAIASDVGLCALSFGVTGRRDRLDARLRKWFSPFELRDQTNPVIEQTRGWLVRYFAGANPDAREPPLDMRGTPFEQRVWDALLDIAPGRTTTYGAIALRLGSAGAARAVGLANGANPVPIVVPCHRVIGTDGTLTGYGGGLERKEWLLRHERGDARLF